MEKTVVVVVVVDEEAGSTAFVGMDGWIAGKRRKV